jgi:hypothetical protein
VNIRSAARTVAILLAVATGYATAARAAPWALAGKYDLDPTASDDIRAAAEKSTEDMNLFIRGIARDRIAENNPPYKHIEISRDDALVTVRFDAENPITLTVDGSPVLWTSEDGTRDQVTARSTGTQLVLQFAGGGGQRLDTFELGPNGKTLDLHIKITSPRLPAPVMYKLAYVKQAP